MNPPVLAYVVVGLLGCTVTTQAHRSLQQTGCGQVNQAPCNVTSMNTPAGLNTTTGCVDLLQPQFGVCTTKPLTRLPPGKCYKEKNLFSAPPFIKIFGLTNTYNYWVNNTYCNFIGDKSIVLDVKVRVHQPDDTCATCPVTPQCTFWRPDSTGRYRGWCSASMTGNSFRMKTSYPGDESKAGFGYDPFSHMHYACCCQDHCWKNKFYLTRSQLDFSIADDRLVTPDDTNVAVEWKPGFYRYTVVIPHDAPASVFEAADAAANNLTRFRAENPLCFKSKPVLWRKRLITKSNACNQ